MKQFFSVLMIIFCFCWGWMMPLSAQMHHAEGNIVRRGNRLISVKSEAGKQLYQPERTFFKQDITADGTMSEPDWKNALVIAPFLDNQGNKEQTTVRLLYDREYIYLYWEIPEKGGITATMTQSDSVITADDYVKIDLKPWLPDSIMQARDYFYTIAVNPKGIMWDAYFDPYLDGFFFSSWNSNAETAVNQNGDFWSAEMIIPFSGLDLYSDPGWKWNVEFFHTSNIEPGVLQQSQPNIGVLVQQDIQVRRPSLVSYYWPRPEFMEEIKPDMNVKQNRIVQALPLNSAPLMNSGKDVDLWASAQVITIEHSDRMGHLLNANRAKASIGITKNQLCLCLEAEGAKIEKAGESSSVLGGGMAGQMAGVNGVFIDRAVFENECFWIILQPQKRGADNIHQDYYQIIVDNQGRIRGTRYDPFGAPSRAWIPEGKVDLYNTNNGWGAEVSMELSSFDIPVAYTDNWGVNIFRNRLLEDKSSELQAWRYTANDYLNPETFGRLANIPEINRDVLASGIQKKLDETKEKLNETSQAYRSNIQQLQDQVNTISLENKIDLTEIEQFLQQADISLGIIEATEYYNSVPHPVQGGYPLMDVQFIGENGWAVGPMGTILCTVDGGESWERIPLQSDVDLYRVAFVDKLHGWTVGGRLRIADTNESMRHDKRGGFGYIYHTQDGGKTWQCQYAERGRLLLGLDFINKEVGYACGERGILLKTEDGGAHWKVLYTSGTMNWLYGIAFKDKNTGFAVGLRETVIKTTDGGQSWTKQNGASDRKIYGFRPIYRDVTFNGDTGCIVGQNGSVLISHDGGDSWGPSATFFKAEIRDLLDLRRVQFVTPRLGYAVGEMGTRIMVTEDGGASWSYRPVPDTEWLRAVWADPQGKVVLVGEREKVMISTDKGFSWKMVQGEHPKADVLVLLAHGDDAAINLNPFFAYYCINQNKTIVDVGVLSDTHSSEYEETYNLEHDRNMWMLGVRTASNFNEFETGNNGSDYYHFTERLWEGEENVIRHMVAAIRAYRPDIIITHGGVFGDYDKPGHKLSGRAGKVAFEVAGGDVDQFPDLTRLGLPSWQPKKLYHLASESYPVTLDLAALAEETLKGTNGTCKDFGEYVIRNFQSQGVYHTRIGKLCLVKSLLPVPEQETSVFDGLKE